MSSPRFDLTGEFVGSVDLCSLLSDLRWRSILSSKRMVYAIVQYLVLSCLPPTVLTPSP